MSLPQKQQQQQQQQQTAKPRPQRDPPPALFLHPSPAGSHVDIPSTAGPAPVITGLPSAQAAAAQQSHPRSSSTLLDPGSQDPLAAALSTLSTKPMDRTTTTTTSSTTAAAASRRVPGALPPLQTAATTRRESTRATDRTDALWSEMQATLEEVELSASGGTRVFGPEHDRKLASLRAAQIALAQAWARSEADDAIETTTAATVAANANSATTERGGGTGELKTDGTAGTADGGPPWSVGTGAGSSSARPGSSAGIAAAADRLGQRLEQETENDLAFARKRREANDQYFQRVNQGVLDVVAKLENVAAAMRAVEQESKDVWGDESVPSSARP